MTDLDRRISDDGYHDSYKEANQSSFASASSNVVGAQPLASEASAGELGLERSPGVVSRETLLAYAALIEQRITTLAVQWFEPAARIVIFVIYFWFGVLKLIGVSPATPLAAALTSHTIGMQYFNTSFKALALYEMAIGIFFLIPAMTRISVVLLVIHMGIVSSPLVLVANVAWIHPMVPTLEGQYIIKDLAIIALAFAIIVYRRLRTEQA